MERKNSFNKIASFLIIAILSLCIHTVDISLNPILASSTSAKAMCLMEASTGRVLESKNENVMLPMASTTKIMTAITAIENCKDLDAIFTVSDASVGVPGTSIYLKKGEEFSVRDLLYGLMLVSGNDASVAIAEHVGGSTEKFVGMMNSLAEKIGAKDSHFMNTHGLDVKGHYTTAKDLALITSYALNNETFKQVVGTKSYKIHGTKEGEIRYLKNKNKLLNSMPGCIGVKTGFTDDAGRCFVGACDRENMTLVCVVLNCGPMFEDTARLIDEAYEKYELIELLESYHYIKHIPVNNGNVEDVKVFSLRGFKYPVTKEEHFKINYVYDLPDSLNAPLSNEQEVGKVSIYLDNNLLFSEKIYTMEKVKSIALSDNIKEIVEQW